jgi:uncharacterized membrane protein
MNKTRLEAFSDGVLAIIITIMVLELKIPHGSEWADLQPVVAFFFSYLLSFIFIGIYWGNHHHLLHTVKNISPGIIWSNMHLLFWLSIIPFATGWMAENGFARNPVIVYSILLLVCGISYTILQLAIQKVNAFTPEMEEAFAMVKKKGVLSVILYSAAIGAAFANTAISGGLIVLVAAMWIVPDKHIEKAIKN